MKDSNTEAQRHRGDSLCEELCNPPCLSASVVISAPHYSRSFV